MRAHEFITENTTSGAIATVATPMGSMLAREPAQAIPGKYTNNSRKRNQDVNRRFKNSFSK